MKVRSIPAQITTVEDKIAGNLNFTQIFLLMLPVFWLMIVYTLFAPYMQFAWYKLPIILVIGVTCVILSIRIKNKLILNWLVILLQYNLRARYYIFNKNDSYLRTMDIISLDKTKRRTHAKSFNREEKRALSAPVSFGDLARLEGLLANPKYSFSIKTQKKGALYVAFEQNKQ